MNHGLFIAIRNGKMAPMTISIVVGDKMEPSPGVRIERRGRRLVIVGGAPFDAVAAVKAGRKERDEVVADRARGK